MTLSTEDELAGELVNQRSERCCIRPQHGEELEKRCRWVHVETVSDWSPGLSGQPAKHTWKRRDPTSSKVDLANRCPCSSTEPSGTPQGESELSMAPGRGLCFIPAVLPPSSVHLEDDQGMSLGISLE